MNKILRLSESNIDSILDLQLKSFPEDLRDSKDFLLKCLEWPIAHGFFEEEILKGLVFGYHHSYKMFHIYSVEVFPKYQKQKIGQELLQYTMDHCKTLNYDKVQAYAVSYGGWKLLLKFGFSSIGEKNINDHKTEIMVFEYGK
jgi:GNAT superfamily N-acetyltransferase